MSLARATWKWAVGAVVVYVLLGLWIGRVPTPSAFIDLQYARSLAAGHGLAFTSLGPPAEGYTSLLWVLVNALLIGAGVNAAAVLPFLSLAAGAACVILVWRLTCRGATRVEQVAVPTFALAVSAPFLVTAMGGTDAPLFSLLLVALIAGIDRLDSEPVAGAALAAAASILAMVCRVEGTLAALVGVWFLIRRPGRARAFAWVVVAALVAFHAWRVVAFGSLLPSSIAVRAGFNAALFAGAQPHDIEPEGMTYLIIAVITVAAVVAGRHDPTRRRNLAAVTVAGAMTLAYLGLRDATPAQGNIAALLPLAIIPWPAAVRAVVPARSSSRTATAALVALVVLVAMGPVADQRLTAARIRESQRDSIAPIGEWIHQQYPDASLATDLPGAITWYAGVPALDLRPRSALGSRPADKVVALNSLLPEIVVLDAIGITGARYMPYIEPYTSLLTSRYRVLAGIRTAWTFDRSAVILLRRDIPPLTDQQLNRIPEGVGSVLRLNR